MKNKIKITKNIIRTGQKYLMCSHYPNEEYPYSWIDFITFPPGYLFDKDIKNELIDKFGKHIFRVCFDNIKDIESIIIELEKIKLAHKKFKEDKEKK